MTPATKTIDTKSTIPDPRTRPDRIMFAGSAVVIPIEDYTEVLNASSRAIQKAQDAESRASFWCDRAGRADRFHRYFLRMIWIASAQGLAILILAAILVTR